MPFDPLHQPLNREVLLYLLATSAVYSPSWGQKPPTEPDYVPLGQMDLGRLRTHPDLSGLLHGVGLELPGVVCGYVLGYSVLCSPDGVIFGLAMSMASMAFRANPPDGRLPTMDAAPKIEALSREWHSCSSFGEPEAWVWLKPLAEQALANVNRLSDVAPHA